MTARPISDLDIANQSIGEWFLGAGLVCLTVGIGLLEFVMIGLLGAALVFLGLILAVVAVILVRDARVAAGRAWGGITVFMIGLLLLIGTAVYASIEAYDIARFSMSQAGPAPTARLWPSVAIGAPIASLILVLGLRLRTEWSMQRLLFWMAAAFLVCPLAVVLFLAFAPVWPLDA